jgi:hypothetical protein
LPTYRYITRVKPGALAVPNSYRLQSCLLVLLVALWAACGAVVARIPGTPFITYSLTAIGTFASG